MGSRPRLSLLSSFSLNPFNQLGPLAWPVGTKEIELYAFMHGQLDFLTDDREALQDRNLTVLSAMALCRTPAEVARRLDERCQRGGLKIIGMSSFLPEIMAPKYQQSAWQAAQNALIFLVELTRELRLLHHPAKTVELVGGSAVAGMWPGRKGDQDVYVLKKQNHFVAIHQLLQRLLPVAEVAYRNPDDPVFLAVEMEPGPLFTIGKISSILEFCRLLDEKDEDPIGRVVGLNLDVPHWDFLGEITVENVLEQPTIIKRILHAHICDHAKGHFCDGVPEFHSAEEFRRWLAFLSGLPSLKEKQKRALPYSGYVSCELEHCCSIPQVSRGLEKLHAILETVGHA